MLRKLLPPTGLAAEFQDASLRVGFVKLPDTTMVCLFNWEDTPHAISFGLPNRSHVTDYWSGKDLGRLDGEFTIKDMPPHSARLLVCN